MAHGWSSDIWGIGGEMGMVLDAVTAIVVTEGNGAGAD